MKTNIIAVTALLALFAGGICSAKADGGNGWDDNGGTQEVLTFEQWQKARKLRTPSLDGPEIIYLSNLVTKTWIVPVVAASSPRIFESQTNTMSGIAGDSVPDDVSANPAAWKPLSPNGFLWHQVVTTTFHSHLGATNGAFGSTEFGSRLSYPIVCFGSPMNKYYKITSSTPTLIPPGIFNVTTNSSNNQLLAYGRNYVGAWYGPNNIAESFFDRTLNVWVRVGDDAVYTAGESPAVVPVTVWLRFGASSFATVSSTAQSDAVRDMFTRSNHWVMGELQEKVGGVFSTLVSASTTSQLATVTITRLPNNEVGLGIANGQPGQGYVFYESTNAEGPYTLSAASVFYPGQLYTNSAPPMMKFYRVAPGTP